VINYRLYGSAPYSAAVIHGVPGALGSMAAVARGLASMGFGVIEPLQTRDSVVGLIDELSETLLENGIVRTALIGHSWGAWLAWLYTAAHPERVSKLFLVGSGPFEASYASSIDFTRKSRLSAEQAVEIDAILTALNNPDTLDKDTWLKRYTLLLDVDNFAPVTVETDADFDIESSGATYRNIFPEAARMRASGELLALSEHIHCPVIAIHGDYDPHPALGVQKPLTQRMNDFNFHLLPRCGHSPWKERYAMEIFYRIVARELSGV